MKASTPTSQAPIRFFDTTPTGVTPTAGSGAGGMTAAEIAFVGLNTTSLADVVSNPTATFTLKTIASQPAGFPAISESDFQVYINGVAIPTVNRSTQQSGSSIVVTFNNLGFTLDPTDQILLVGKYS